MYVCSSQAMATELIFFLHVGQWAMADLEFCVKTVKADHDSELVAFRSIQRREFNVTR